MTYLLESPQTICSSGIYEGKEWGEGNNSAVLYLIEYTGNSALRAKWYLSSNCMDMNWLHQLSLTFVKHSFKLTDRITSFFVWIRRFLITCKIPLFRKVIFPQVCPFCLRTTCKIISIMETSTRCIMQLDYFVFVWIVYTSNGISWLGKFGLEVCGFLLKTWTWRSMASG